MKITNVFLSAVLAMSAMSSFAEDASTPPACPVICPKGDKKCAVEKMAGSAKDVRTDIASLTSDATLVSLDSNLEGLIKLIETKSEIDASKISELKGYLNTLLSSYGLTDAQKQHATTLRCVLPK